MSENQKQDRKLILLHELRSAEFETVLQLLPVGGSILEIGAGSGWQAKCFSEKGYTVTAIDLRDSLHKSQRIWPIMDYDGKVLPFKDHSFDIVFSSNTLEHVKDIDEFLLEAKRVMKPAGMAVHVLPTSSWRFWSALGHYFRFREAWGERRAHPATPAGVVHADASCPAEVGAHGRRNLVQALLRNALPDRHGVRGNIFTEHYYFTEWFWREKFQTAGYKILKIKSNRLFYTGCHYFGSNVPINFRRKLSRLAGSACKIYVLRSGI